MTFWDIRSLGMYKLFLELCKTNTFIDKITGLDRRIQMSSNGNNDKQSFSWLAPEAQVCGWHVCHRNTT